jgi:hypothetical protein
MAHETDYLIDLLLFHCREQLAAEEIRFLDRARGAWLTSAQRRQISVIAERVRLSDVRGPMER